MRRILPALLLLLATIASGEDGPFPAGDRQTAEERAAAVIAKPASATAAIAAWSAAWQRGDLKAGKSLSVLVGSHRFRQEQPGPWWTAVQSLLLTLPDEANPDRAEASFDHHLMALLQLPLAPAPGRDVPPSPARLAEMRAYLPALMPILGWYLRWSDESVAVSASAAAWPDRARERFRSLIAGLRGSLYERSLLPWLVACYRGRPEARADLAERMQGEGFPAAAQAEILAAVD